MHESVVDSSNELNDIINNKIDFKIHTSISEIDAQDWNDCVESKNPFMEHAFLDSLETHHTLEGIFMWTVKSTLWKSINDGIILSWRGYMSCLSSSMLLLEELAT